MPDRVGINKIYEVSYPTVYAQSGRRKPEVDQALVDAINNGSLVLSFVGHGNPNVWTHESVLNVPSTIDKFHNFDRLTYLTASTCDFSRYDDFSYVSGGVLFVIKPDAGAIGALGTSRSVTEESVLVKQFYQTLFNESDATLHGTSTAGEALLAAKRAAGPYASNLQYYYLLGDPAQRLLLPKEYVTFDSLNSMAVDTGHLIIPALSELTVSGSIRPTSDPATTVDRSFNGTVTVTLFDSPTLEQATTNFTIDPPYHDKYWIEGPILYRGRATVTDGRFSIQFVVPRDVKLDGGAVKLSGYAYGIDTRTALGDTKQLTLSPSDSALTVVDTSGPTLKIYLGTRAFQSGDDVSMHSTAIVDVHDTHGLNTSTASIGHSFIAWVDDAQDSAIDLASTYVSNPNDFTNGSSVHPIELPAGHHTLHVRAFDTFDNPAFGSVDFVAKKDAPFRLYEVTNDPNPIFDHTTFRFTQPGAAGTLVHIDLTLYTTDGRHVRTLNTDTQASSVELAWDGRDDAGIPVANGVYIFQIDARDLDDGSSTSAEGKCIMAR